MYNRRKGKIPYGFGIKFTWK